MIKQHQNKNSDLQVLLVNTMENTNAKIDDSGFEQSWNWIETPAGWTPDDEIPAEPEQLDGIVVFSPLYEECLIRGICEAIHEKLRFESVPIVVAIDPPKMPPAHREREFDEGIFVFSPLHEASLLKRFARHA